jgi:hypothetical protein
MWCHFFPLINTDHLDSHIKGSGGIHMKMNFKEFDI